ncbi:MAG: 1-(5-phosphoribosyl)-5-[Bacteroidaceae bacterium]|nr:1-(5-phosphoribosyl)-5-[(5-phosphoribosylamino)methylideneamino]imidazole-4-carboxamide isomerase [Bacteroidaceae bacterium]
MRIELIPAIDIIDGKCVRLTQGDYSSQKVYNENPVEVAREFADYGIRRLHIVDLDGAKSQHVVNLQVVEQIRSATDLVIDFGGGVKSDADLQKAFDAGADMVTIGSLAVKQPETFLRWLDIFGASRIILGADVRNGLISINGWQEEDGEQLIPFVRKYVEKGVVQVLCTDISKDGMLQGPAIELYRQVLSSFPDLHLIASGGVSSIDDIKALDEAGVPAVVFGKAIYEGKIKLSDLVQA